MSNYDEYGLPFLPQMRPTRHSNIPVRHSIASAKGDYSCDEIGIETSGVESHRAK